MTDHSNGSVESEPSPATSPTGLVVPEMTPQDLETVRHQLEPHGWVFTHRMLVYHMPDGDLEHQLTDNCPSFARLTETQQLRLLRSVSEFDERTTRCQSLRYSYLQPFMAELTRSLSPIGKLRDLDWSRSLEKLLAGAADETADQQLGEIAGRHFRRLRRLDADDRTGLLSTIGKEVDGNGVAFPLDPDVTPEILRAEIYNSAIAALNGDWNDSGFDRNYFDEGCSCLAAREPLPAVMSPCQLYRPYLNDWQPFDVSEPATSNTDSENGLPFDSLTIQRNRRLLTVTGGLTWRQKQHRQQLLAVRLATRSALIGLKHSINVEPAKNYLELYVNMISRAVEATSVHVRRWSFQLERSWKQFKDLAADDAP